MAIRIRIIDGRAVALNAAITKAEKGDIYLNDGAHHALATKFGVDWRHEGWLKDDMADPVIKDLMLHEENKHLLKLK